MTKTIEHKIDDGYYRRDVFECLSLASNLGTCVVHLVCPGSPPRLPPYQDQDELSSAAHIESTEASLPHTLTDDLQIACFQLQSTALFSWSQGSLSYVPRSGNRCESR